MCLNLLFSMTLLGRFNMNNLKLLLKALLVNFGKFLSTETSVDDSDTKTLNPDMHGIKKTSSNTSGSKFFKCLYKSSLTRMFIFYGNDSDTDFL